MRSALLAFIIGLLSIRLFPFLPSLSIGLAFCIIGLVLFWWRCYPIACLLLGIAWSSGFAYYSIESRLDPALDGKALWIEGVVVGLPEQSENVTRFQITNTKNQEVMLPKLIRLSWYKDEPISTGEQWRLKIKIKYPRGTVNPGVFDYEAWLTSKHIGATGTVREGQRLQASTYNDWRYKLREKIQQTAPQQAAGIIALVLGDGSGLSSDEWQVLQNTGTVHLMVISGQHITLLACFLYFLVGGLARLGYWPKRLPWLPCACALAMLGAITYGLLAGGGVPVDSIIMLFAISVLCFVYVIFAPLIAPIIQFRHNLFLVNLSNSQSLILSI